MKIDHFTFHPDTRGVYKYIRRYIKKIGLSPTFREIGIGCGISAAKAQREVRHLVAWGYLAHISGRARSITLPDSHKQVPMTTPTHPLDDNPSQTSASLHSGQNNIGFEEQGNTTTAADIPELQTSSEASHPQSYTQKALDKLDSPFSREVMDGLELLGLLKDPSAIPDLIRTLNHAHNPIMHAAHEILVAMADAAVPHLLDAMVTETDHILWQAATALSQIKSDASFQGLLALAGHSNARIRQIALYALGPFQDIRAMPALRLAINDHDSIMRAEALRTLGGIATEEATSLIRGSLKDPEPSMRAQAVSYLGQRHNIEDVPELIQALGDSDVFVRTQAVLALGHIQGPVAVEALVSYSKDSVDAMRMAVAQVLGEFDSLQVMATLNEMLNDELLNIRTMAQQSLYQILRRRHE